MAEAAELPVVDHFASATVEADGTITLLGRGSQVVNTGGKKVFAGATKALAEGA